MDGRKEGKQKELMCFHSGSSYGINLGKGVLDRFDFDFD